MLVVRYGREGKARWRSGAAGDLYRAAGRIVVSGTGDPAGATRDSAVALRRPTRRAGGGGGEEGSCHTAVGWTVGMAVRHCHPDRRGRTVVTC